MINISDYIPTGYRNRISRELLIYKTGYSDRTIREMIAESEDLIINVDKGYFIPDETCIYDRELTAKYFEREMKRAEAVLKKMGKYKVMTNGRQYRIPLSA